MRELATFGSQCHLAGNHFMKQDREKRKEEGGGEKIKGGRRKVEVMDKGEEEG